MQPPNPPFASVSQTASGGGFDDRHGREKPPPMGAVSRRTRRSEAARRVFAGILAAGRRGGNDRTASRWPSGRTVNERSTSAGGRPGVFQNRTTRSICGAASALCHSNEGQHRTSSEKKLETPFQHILIGSSRLHVPVGDETMPLHQASPGSDLSRCKWPRHSGRDESLPCVCGNHCRHVPTTLDR